MHQLQSPSSKETRARIASLFYPMQKEEDIAARSPKRGTSTRPCLKESEETGTTDTKITPLPPFALSLRSGFSLGAVSPRTSIGTAVSPRNGHTIPGNSSNQPTKLRLGLRETPPSRSPASSKRGVSPSGQGAWNRVRSPAPTASKARVRAPSAESAASSDATQPKSSSDKKTALLAEFIRFALSIQPRRKNSAGEPTGTVSMPLDMPMLTRRAAIHTYKMLEPKLQGLNIFGFIRSLDRLNCKIKKEDQRLLFEVLANDRNSVLEMEQFIKSTAECKISKMMGQIERPNSPRNAGDVAKRKSKGSANKDNVRRHTAERSKTSLEVEERVINFRRWTAEVFDEMDGFPAELLYRVRQKFFALIPKVDIKWESLDYTVDRYSGARSIRADRNAILAFAAAVKKKRGSVLRTFHIDFDTLNTNNCDRREFIEGSKKIGFDPVEGKRVFELVKGKDAVVTSNTFEALHAIIENTMTSEGKYPSWAIELFQSTSHADRNEVDGDDQTLTEEFVLGQIPKKSSGDLKESGEITKKSEEKSEEKFEESELATDEGRDTASPGSREEKKEDNSNSNDKTDHNEDIEDKKETTLVAPDKNGGGHNSREKKLKKHKELMGEGEDKATSTVPTTTKSNDDLDTLDYSVISFRMTDDQTPVPLLPVDKESSRVMSNSSSRDRAVGNEETQRKPVIESTEKGNSKELQIISGGTTTATGKSVVSESKPKRGSSHSPASPSAAVWKSEKGAVLFDKVSQGETTTDDAEYEADKLFGSMKKASVRMLVNEMAEINARARIMALGENASEHPYRRTSHHSKGALDRLVRTSDKSRISSNYSGASVSTSPAYGGAEGSSSPAYATVLTTQALAGAKRDSFMTGFKSRFSLEASTLSPILRTTALRMSSMDDNRIAPRNHVNVREMSTRDDNRISSRNSANLREMSPFSYTPVISLSGVGSLTTSPRLSHTRDTKYSAPMVTPVVSPINTSPAPPAPAAAVSYGSSMSKYSPPRRSRLTESARGGQHGPALEKSRNPGTTIIEESPTLTRSARRFSANPGTVVLLERGSGQGDRRSFIVS